jgi:hypothetical protein
MTTPKIPRGWRRITVGSAVKTGDRIKDGARWYTFRGWAEYQVPVRHGEIVIRRKARKTK